MTENPLQGIYPLNWDEYIGQDMAKAQLKAAIMSATIRDTRLPHILIAAEAGQGKTAIAQLVAQDMGCQMRVVTGKMNAAQVRMILAELADKDILLLDEIHGIVQGGKANGEWALHLLENGSIMGPMGLEKQPDITIIGATTDVGKLPDTIIDRFGVKPNFVPYTDDEATQIAHVLALKIFDNSVPVPAPGEANCAHIALLADRNPRLMRGLMENLRDSAVAGKGKTFDPKTHEYDMSEVLRWNGLTEDGLTDEAVRYMIALKRAFAGGAGSTALKEALNAPGGLRRTELLLGRRGFIARTKQGRVLTAAGIQRTLLLEREGVTTV